MLYHVRDLEVREPDIEDTIRRIYEECLLEPEQGDHFNTSNAT